MSQKTLLSGPHFCHQFRRKEGRKEGRN